MSKPAAKTAAKVAVSTASRPVSKAAANPASRPAASKSISSTVSKIAAQLAARMASSKSPAQNKPAQTTAKDAPAPKMIRTYSPPVQPMAPELPVVRHKYQVGETVYFTSPNFGRASASGTYTVIKLLPSESDDYQYRIKSSGEAFERVAKESQLDRV